MLSWVREKLAESRVRWQQHLYQPAERSSISPPPLPPPDLGESPESTPIESTYFNPIISGTQFTPADNQILASRPSTNLALPLKINYTTNSNQQTPECLESIHQTWSLGYKRLSTQYTENRCIKEASGRHVILRVFTCDGFRCTINIPAALTGIDVKNRALAEFHSTNQLPAYTQLKRQDDNSAGSKDLGYLAKIHKLARINHIHEHFDEQIPLASANVQNYEELLLIRCKNASNSDLSHKESAMAGRICNIQCSRFSEGHNSTNECDYINSVSYYSNEATPPTQAEIDSVTWNLDTGTTIKINVINVDEFVSQNDVQHDIRRILISLSNSCAHIIGSGPYANRVIHVLKQKLIQRKRFECDTQQCLVDMGFAQRNVQHALHICNHVYAAALEWLIENPSPTDCFAVTDNNTDVNLSANCVTGVNMTDNIESLQEIIRIYGQHDAPPSTEIIQLFIDMGFDEVSAREALRIAGNHHSLACEWLVGNRTKTIREHYNGLPIDSPVLNSLLNSPHIQLSLSSPKTLFAYLSILEDYAAIGIWLNDSEISNIISQILRIYHEEKHIYAINQFSNYI